VVGRGISIACVRGRSGSSKDQVRRGESEGQFSGRSSATRTPIIATLVLLLVTGRGEAVAIPRKHQVRNMRHIEGSNMTVYEEIKELLLNF
jgi:hypothetical protein